MFSFCTSKFDVTPVNFMVAERRLLVLSGLPLDKFEIKLINVAKSHPTAAASQTADPVYIRTIVCDYKPEKPVLLKIHGYGSGSAMFYKCIKDLTAHFTVILLDLPGMAGSTRTSDYDFESMSAQDSIDYFVDYIEGWRRAMGNLTNLYVIGHSLGGYIVGNYALKYP